MGTVVIDVTKADLREIMLQKRLEKGEIFIKSASADTQRRCLEFLKTFTFETVAVYFPFRNEVETDWLVAELARTKQVVFPRRIKGSKVLKFYALENQDAVHLMGKGLREPDPAKSREISLDDIRVFVLPGLAFDSQGYRLGYGHGHYDQTLVGMSRSLLVALCFEFQVISSLPWTNHDVNVGNIVTESRIIDCW